MGDYVAGFYGVGYAVYSCEENKLISVEKAYNKGIITNEISKEISVAYADNKDEALRVFFPVGDLNLDATIDIMDVVTLRGFIVNSFILDETVSLCSDLNNDGVFDISDVVIMRSIIVNG